MSEEEISLGYEQVFTVSDYFDDPRTGVANYKGQPHYYECVFDKAADQYSDLYRLTPVAPDKFHLVLEDWTIWQRWLSAFNQGAAPRESHPALPDDRARHDQIIRALNGGLTTDPEKYILRKGSFEVFGSATRPTNLRRYQVKWTEPQE